MDKISAFDLAVMKVTDDILIHLTDQTGVGKWENYQYRFNLARYVGSIVRQTLEHIVEQLEPVNDA